MLIFHPPETCSTLVAERRVFFFFLFSSNVPSVTAAVSQRWSSERRRIIDARPLRWCFIRRVFVVLNKIMLRKTQTSADDGCTCRQRDRWHQKRIKRVLIFGFSSIFFLRKHTNSVVSWNTELKQNYGLWVLQRERKSTLKWLIGDTSNGHQTIAILC